MLEDTCRMLEERQARTGFMQQVAAQQLFTKDMHLLWMFSGFKENSCSGLTEQPKVFLPDSSSHLAQYRQPLPDCSTVSKILFFLFFSF